MMNFCKYCKKWAKASSKTGGTWVTIAFSNWKKAVAKMKEHAESVATFMHIRLRLVVLQHC